MPKYRIDWTCDYVGDFGYAILFQDSPPEDWEIEEMAIQQFQPFGEVTELEDDDE